jgi:hypothetical protein
MELVNVYYKCQQMAGYERHGIKISCFKAVYLVRVIKIVKTTLQVLMMFMR